MATYIDDLVSSASTTSSLGQIVDFLSQTNAMTAMEISTLLFRLHSRVGSASSVYTTAVFSPNDLAEAINVVDALHWGISIDTASSAASSTSIDVATAKAIHLHIQALAADDLESQANLTSLFAVSLVANDLVKLGHQLSFLSSANVDGLMGMKVLSDMFLSDDINVQSLAETIRRYSDEVSSALFAATDISTLLKAYAPIAESLSTESRALIGSQIVAALIDALNINDAIDYYVTLFSSMDSTASLASSTGVAIHAEMLLHSITTPDDVLQTSAVLNNALSSDIVASTVFRIGDDVYEGWVYHAESSAFTQYKNYPFKDITQFKGRYYGVADDGIYLLEGDDDAGQAIAASFKTGLLDLGARQLKDAKAFYLGYTSDGQIVLKVTTTGQGTKREDWYRMKQGSSDAIRTGRVDIQRGLRSRYWQFELCNVDGADFEVDDATLLYQVLSRRIR